MERIPEDKTTSEFHVQGESLQVLRIMGESMPINPAAWALLPEAFSEVIRITNSSSDTILEENIPVDLTTI